MKGTTVVCDLSFEEGRPTVFERGGEKVALKGGRTLGSSAISGEEKRAVTLWRTAETSSKEKFREETSG